jgi:hypothetical protein
VNSNMIMLEADSFFPDFGGFVIVRFFINPPAVGPVFSFTISQIIAMLGTCQKTGDQQDDDNGRRDEPAFCDERYHEGSNPLALIFMFSLRRFRQKLNLFLVSAASRLDRYPCDHAAIFS